MAYIAVIKLVSLKPLFLPPRSPDLNAVEIIWELLKKDIGNFTAQSFEQIDERVAQTICKLLKLPDRIKSATKLQL